jgi:glycosyltransferase involved in cell wall biosynthesis
MTSEIFDYASDQILILGYKPDLAPLLESARILIAPLRFGAGMKGKIGQALSHGVPVVTTTIGCEGFSLTNGQHAMIADDPATLANSIFQVYTDRNLWGKLSENGHQYIQENLSPRVVQEKIHDALGSLVSCSSRQKTAGRQQTEGPTP